MAPTWLLDDETIDDIVASRDVDDRCRSVAAIARGIEALGDEPVPPPSRALTALFAEARPGSPDRGPASEPVATIARHARRAPHRRRSLVAARVAGWGLAAKIAAGGAVAAAGVVVAGAGGVLPDAATARVRAGIEAITPVEFRDPAATSEPARGSGGEGFGDRVSDDATGQSDGTRGVDGPTIAGETPAGDRPTAGAAADGLDRARETPAQPHVPDTAADPGGPDEPVPADGTDDDDDQNPSVTAPGVTAPGRDGAGGPPSSPPAVSGP